MAFYIFYKISEVATLGDDLYKSTIVEAINEINRSKHIMSIRSLLSYSFIIIDSVDNYNIIKVSQAGKRKIKLLYGIKKSLIKYNYSTLKDYYNCLKDLEDPNEIFNLLTDLISFVLRK